MAAATIRTKFAVVYVVGAMAVAAPTAQFPLHVERLSMTGITLDLSVRAIEQERRLQVVIESPI